MLRLSIFGTFRVADASGAAIPIKSRKSRALLAYLALPLGKPRSREQIMALLWSDRNDQQARSSLRQALHSLRKDLGEEGLSALRITGESLTLDPDRAVVEPTSPGQVLLDGLHLNDPAFDEWLRDERLRHEDVATPEPISSRPSHSDKLSVAVLPFVNMSGDPDQEYFSDGITEDIITDLCRFSQLVVMARNSAFVFKGQNVAMDEIGQRLGVQHVVEGSVRKAGDRIRVTVQLVDVSTDEHLWAERYDRDLADIFAVQDEIASTIAATVAGKVTRARARRARLQPTSSLSAYDNYLRARECFRRYEGFSEAEPFLLKAIELDPRFAPAHALLSAVYIVRYFYDGELSELDRSLECGKAAVELEPDEAMGHLEVGRALTFMGRHDQAKIHLDRAISLNPNQTVIRFVHALWLLYVGNVDEAVAACDFAFRRDPFPDDWCWDIWGMVLTVSGRYQEAIMSYEHMMRIPPWGCVYLAVCHEQLGQIDKAKDFVAEYRASAANGTIDRFFRAEPYRDPAVIERFSAALVKAGLPRR